MLSQDQLCLLQTRYVKWYHLHRLVLCAVLRGCTEVWSELKKRRAAVIQKIAPIIFNRSPYRTFCHLFWSVVLLHWISNEMEKRELAYQLKIVEKSAVLTNSLPVSHILQRWHGGGVVITFTENLCRSSLVIAFWVSEGVYVVLNVWYMSICLCPMHKKPSKICWCTFKSTKHSK